MFSRSGGCLRDVSAHPGSVETYTEGRKWFARWRQALPVHGLLWHVTRGCSMLSSGLLTSPWGRGVGGRRKPSVADVSECSVSSFPCWSLVLPGVQHSSRVREMLGYVRGQGFPGGAGQGEQKYMAGLCTPLPRPPSIDQAGCTF